MVPHGRKKDQPLSPSHAQPHLPQSFSTPDDAAATAGPITDDLMATMAAKIEAALGPGTSAAVSDASGDGRHVVVDVVSPSFAEAKSTMQRQRAVFKALWEELSDDGMVHAVDAMTTRTPEEAASGGQ